jgi:hypothetical protein
VDDSYLHELHDRGAALEAIHEELLPLDEVDLEAGGSAVWIGPYQSTLESGLTGVYNLAVRNPFSAPVDAEVTLVVPDGWLVRPETVTMALAVGETATREFTLTPSGAPARRVRIAADATMGGRRFGQITEALVTVTAPTRSPAAVVDGTEARALPELVAADTRSDRVDGATDGDGSAARVTRSGSVPRVASAPGDG